MFIMHDKFHDPPSRRAPENEILLIPHDAAGCHVDVDKTLSSDLPVRAFGVRSFLTTSHLGTHAQLLSYITTRAFFVLCFALESTE